MPRRYYFAPVDSGMGDVGRALGGAIANAPTDFQNARSAEEQRQQRAEGAARDRELYDLELFEQGYRRGETPRETVDFRSGPSSRPERPGRRAPETAGGSGNVFEGGIGMQRRQEPAGDSLFGAMSPSQAMAPRAARSREDFSGSIFADGGAGAGIERIPDERLRAQVTKPGYQQISDDLYLDQNATPEARGQLAQRTQMGEQEDEIFQALVARGFPEEEARGEAKMMVQGIDGAVYGAMNRRGGAPQEMSEEDADILYNALLTRYPSMTEEMAANEVELIRRGMTGQVPNFSGMGGAPSSATPQRGTPEYIQMLEDENAARARGTRQGQPAATSSAGGTTTTGATSSRSAPTFGQAQDAVNELYAVRNSQGEVAGYILSQMERFELAQALSRGENPEIPDPDSIRQALLDSLTANQEPEPTTPTGERRSLMDRLFGRFRNDQEDPDAGMVQGFRPAPPPGRERQLPQNFSFFPDQPGPAAQPSPRGGPTREQIPMETAAKAPQLPGATIPPAESRLRIRQDPAAQPRPGDQLPPDIDREVIEQGRLIVQEFSFMPIEEIRELLEENGFSEAEILYILEPE